MHRGLWLSLPVSTVLIRPLATVRQSQSAIRPPGRARLRFKSAGRDVDHSRVQTRARDLLLPALAATTLATLLAKAGLLTTAFTDYEAEAEPALTLLRGGDLVGFVQALPAYGGSLILRAPFALASELWNGSADAVFRSMAVPCLVASVVLAVVLWNRLVDRGGRRWHALLAVAICAGNPLTLRALETGHPEELLGAVLCVAAVLAAGANRAPLAGVLLGLAIANKPWAILAVVPVMLALPDRHVAAATIAAVVTSSIMAPMLLLGGAAGAVSAAATQTGEIFQPWQVWWFLGEHGETVRGLYGEKPGYRAAPAWLGSVARPVVILVALAVSLALARRVRSRPWHDALLLLALVLLLRCLLDPWNVVYYELPFLLALLAWEVHARPGWPLLSLIATALSWLTLEQLTTIASPDLQAAAFLAWSVPVAVAMAVRLSGRSLVPDGVRTRAGGRAAIVQP